jgi:hypothetical protein
MKTFSIKLNGQPVKGPHQINSHTKPVEYVIESDPNNQVTCYFSDDPDPKTNGFALVPGDRMSIVTVNFGEIWFDAAGPAQVIRVLQPGV